MQGWAYPKPCVEVVECDPAAGEVGQYVLQPSWSSLQHVLLGGGGGGELTLHYHDPRSLIRFKDSHKLNFLSIFFFREIAKIWVLAVFQGMEMEVHNIVIRQGRGKG